MTDVPALHSSTRSVLRSGLDRFDGAVAAVPAGGWDALTPCQGWTAGHLVGHLVDDLHFALDVIAGREHNFAEDPRTLAGTDPGAAWRAARDKLAPLVAQADLDTVDETPMGPRARGWRLAFPAMDLHLHAWDLGRAFGADLPVAAEAQLLSHVVLDALPEQALRSPGVFGPVVDLPADAEDHDRFLAWAGRDPRS